MAEVKWIKITTNMFDDEKIKLIDAMPERDTIHYIWIRLLTQAGKTNAAGYIFLTENIPYTEEMLSTLFNRQPNSVRYALKILSKYNMIKIGTNNIIKITNWEKHQNVDKMESIREYNRIAKKKERERKKLLISENQHSVNDMSMAHKTNDNDSQVTEVEVDIEEEKEIYTTTATKLDNDYLTFFQNNFYDLASFEIELLKRFENEGIEAAVITLALREAAEANKKEMRYVKKILDRYLENKIFKIENFIADKAKFENKKNNTGKQFISGKSKVKSNFNNFEQRTYDFEDLEKKLLGWDKYYK